MRNLLRCRRGSAAFATVVALVPLIGVVALGAEAGSWYVTKQHAQNAADAAAYSGGLKLACQIILHPARIHKQWTIAVSNLRHRTRSATLATPPIRTPVCHEPSDRNLTDRPDQYAHGIGLGTCPTSAACLVQATVNQQQPTYLAKLLGLSTVNIGAQAVAQVNSLPTSPCALALTGSFSFQGSANINAPNCGMASNDTATECTKLHRRRDEYQSPPSLSAAGGCAGAACSVNRVNLSAAGHQSLLRSR